MDISNYIVTISNSIVFRISNDLTTIFCSEELLFTVDTVYGSSLSKRFEFRVVSDGLWFGCG